MIVKNVRVVINPSEDIFRKLKLMSLRNNLLHAFRRINMCVITLPHHNRYSKTHSNTLGLERWKAVRHRHNLDSETGPGLTTRDTRVVCSKPEGTRKRVFYRRYDDHKTDTGPTDSLGDYRHRESRFLRAVQELRQLACIVPVRVTVILDPIVTSDQYSWSFITRPTSHRFSVGRETKLSQIPLSRNSSIETCCLIAVMLD